MDIKEKIGHSASCIGCRIVSGEVTPPGGIIKETRNFLLHQDPEIPIRGFLIITSRVHIRSMKDMSLMQSQELFELCYQARKALESVDGLLGCTILQEERSGHFHLWLLPRYKWMDGLFDGTLSSIRPLTEYAKANLNTRQNISTVIDTANTLRGIMP